MIWWIVGAGATLYVAGMILIAFACGMSDAPQYNNPTWWKLILWPLFLSELGPQ